VCVCVCVCVIVQTTIDLTGPFWSQVTDEAKE
jgi:hypothetical protein